MVIDFQLEGIELPGKSVYDISPEFSRELKQIFSECIPGKINICAAYLMKGRQDLNQWLKWDIRPWYINKHEVGGLLLNIQDITFVKQQESAAKRIEQLLDKSCGIGKIGTWERNLKTGKVTINKVTMDILEIEKIEIIQKPIADNLVFYKAEKGGN